MRQKVRMLRIDEQLYRKLEEIKARKILNGEHVNLSELTRMIIETPSFRKIEEELIGHKGKMVCINIKMDGMLR